MHKGKKFLGEPVENLNTQKARAWMASTFAQLLVGTEYKADDLNSGFGAFFIKEGKKFLLSEGKKIFGEPVENLDAQRAEHG